MVITTCPPRCTSRPRLYAWLVQLAHDVVEQQQRPASFPGRSALAGMLPFRQHEREHGRALFAL